MRGYRGEGAIPLEGRKAEVLGLAPVELGRGLWVNALKADGRDDAAKAEVIRAWTTLSVDAATEALFLRDWSDTLAPHHAARLDNLLWLGLRNEADRMIARVPPCQGADGPQGARQWRGCGDRCRAQRVEEHRRACL
ncbi:MAG: hypothetical protein GKR99_01845 [Rhodobacteraceae bacterium]|nr:hypothetical protein [Paracoccaceae bacterium]